MMKRIFIVTTIFIAFQGIAISGDRIETIGIEWEEIFRPPKSYFDMEQEIEKQSAKEIEAFGCHWAFLDSEITDALDKLDSDTLYFLTCAASRNPVQSRIFLNNLLQGKYENYTGHIPPLCSEEYVLRHIDLMKYFPDLVNESWGGERRSLLILRNISRTLDLSWQQKNKYLRRIIDFEPISFGSIENSDLSKNSYYDLCNLRTPNLSAFLKGISLRYNDSDEDGVCDRRDKNPLQRNGSRHSLEEELCARSIGLKIYLARIRKGYALVKSPEPLHIEIPTPSEVQVINVLENEMDIISNYLNANTLYLEDMSQINVEHPNAWYSYRAANIDDAILYSVDRTVARIAVSEVVGDHVFTTMFEYVFYQEHWQLNEIFDDLNQPLNLFSSSVE